MIRPKESEYAAAFRGYVGLVPESDVLPILETQLEDMQRLASAVPGERETFAYAPGKWTLREVIGHLGDGERVFGFRAFCFSRGDANPLPGFDENDYVVNANSNARPLAELIQDFVLLRQTNVRMFRELRPDQWELAGTSNGERITVRALAFIMAGHVRHHFGILWERYEIQI